MNLAPGRVAVWTSCGLLVLLLVAALFADLVAANLLGFTFDEVHARDSLLPPGSLSIPNTGRTYDGNDEAYALLDRNGDQTLSVSPPEGGVPGVEPPPGGRGPGRVPATMRTSSIHVGPERLRRPPMRTMRSERRRVRMTARRLPSA